MLAEDTVGFSNYQIGIEKNKKIGLSLEHLRHRFEPSKQFSSNGITALQFLLLHCTVLVEKWAEDSYFCHVT